MKHPIAVTSSILIALTLNGAKASADTTATADQSSQTQTTQTTATPAATTTADTDVASTDESAPAEQTDQPTDSAAAQAARDQALRELPNNSADSVLGSFGQIFTNSAKRGIQGENNTLGAWTLGLPSTLNSVIGRIQTSDNILEDVSRAIPELSDRWTDFWANGISSNPILAFPGKMVAAVVPPIMGAVSWATATLGKLFPISFKIWTAPAKIQTPDALDKTLPTIQLIGDEFLMESSNPSTMQFQYDDPQTGDSYTGYTESTWQGNSTRSLPKKSYKFKLYDNSIFSDKLKTDFFKEFGYAKSNKFRLKAYATDATFARDLVNNQLYKDILATQTNLPDQLKEAPALGTTVGKPVRVIINGIDRGLYMLEPSDTEAAYGMDEDDANDVAVVANNNSTKAVMFESDSAKLDGSDFKSDLNDLTDQQKAGFNQMMSFVNNSSDAEFKQNISQYMDVESVIDHYLFSNWIQGADNLVKNVEYLSYDGGKTWRMLDQDFDLTWGMNVYGLSISNTKDLYWQQGSDKPSYVVNRLVQRVAQLFQPEIKTRYQELRSKGLIDSQKAINAFADFMTQPGMKEGYQADQQANPAVFSYNFTSFQQVADTITSRTNMMDQHFLK